MHQNSADTERLVKPTPKRYLIVLLIAINVGNKGFQWIQNSASTKKLAYYYGVDNYAINGTSALFMVTYALLAFPACCLVDRLGLRLSVVLSSLGTAIGSIIKCFSCHENGLGTLYIGLMTVSISEQFVVATMSRAASLWFPNKQVSSAVAFAVFGYQAGCALGFLVPQWAFSGIDDKPGIGANLLLIYQVNAAISVLTFLADLIWFDDEPKYPPSQARLKQIEHETEMRNRMPGLWQQLGKLTTEACQQLSDLNYLKLNLSLAINRGLMFSFATVLNQMLSAVWPGEEMRIGVTGFIIVLAGACSSQLWGTILDRWRRYKLVNCLVTVGLILSFCLFGAAASYWPEPWLVYLVAASVGLYQTGTIVAGWEFAIELTYPANELVTIAVINLNPQFVGMGSIFAASFLVDNYGGLVAIGFFVIATMISLFFLLIIKEDLKRQRAAKEKQESELNEFNGFS